MAEGTVEGLDLFAKSVSDRIAEVNAQLQGLDQTLLHIVEDGKKIGTSIKGADSLKAIKTQTTQVTASQIELQKVEKQIATVQAKNNSEYIKAAKALTQVKNALKDKTVLGERDAKTINQQNASLKQLEAALKKNKEAYKSMANEEERASKEGKELKAIIDSQATAVKAENAALGDFHDNVGNYEGALKGLKNELKLARDQMAFLAKTTGTTSTEFVEAAEKAGELKDQINDLNDAMKNTSASKFENLKNSLGDVGSKLLNLDFDGAAQSANQFAAVSKSLTFKDITRGLDSFAGTLATVGRAILTNPIFILLGVITAVALALKYFNDQQNKASERLIARYKREEEALTNRYDKEIKLQQILGKQTFELEKAKQRIIAESATKQLKALRGVTEVDILQTLLSGKVAFKVNEEKIQQSNDLVKAKRAALDEIEIIEAEQAEFERKTAADTAKLRRDELFNLNKFRLQLAMEGQQEIIDNEKASYKDRERAVSNFYRIQNQLAVLERNNAIAQENITKEAILLINEEFNAKLIKNRKEAYSELKKLDEERLAYLQSNAQKAADNADKTFGAVRKKLDDDYNKPIKTSFFDSIQKGISETAAKMRKNIFSVEKWKESAEGVLKGVQSIFNTWVLSAADLFDSLSDRRIANLQKEQKILDENYERDLARAGDNERAKEQLDAKYEKEREKLDRQILREKQKQARLDKVLAITQIAIDTAKNVVKVFPNPFLMAAAIALGGVQSAAVIAKPIPQFFKGTKSAPGGLAMVGEQGPELMKRPGHGYELTPSVATVMNVPRGTEIVPHAETMRRLAMGALHQNGGTIMTQSRDGEMIHELKQLNANMSKNKPVKQSLVRSGATVYHAIRDAEGHTKLVRGINLGRWF